MGNQAADHDLVPLPRTLAALEAGRERGLHDAAQVHVRLGADRSLSVSVGKTGTGRLVDETTAFPWTCATKPVLAIGLGVLADRGVLELDEPLARRIPEAPGHWGPISLTHLLTHTVGWVGDPGSVASLTDWDDAVSRVLAHGQVQEGWAPGDRAAYSVWTGWLLLGEVLRRAAGEDVAAWLRREVLDPAGLAETTLVLSPADYATRLPNLARLQHRTRESHPYLFDGPEYAHRCWPGLSARGPTADLVRLFEALLLDGRGGGPGVLRQETAARLVRVARHGLIDETSGLAHDWGLGVAVDRRAVHPKAAAGTFSHAGIGSSAFVFADPDRALVAAYATDGIPGGVPAMARRFGLVQAIYADAVAHLAGVHS